MRYVAIILGLALFVSVACESKQENLREKSVDTRIDTMDRAQKQYPLPLTANFPIREALVKYTSRQDLINHPWYVYVMGDNGNIIGYYVAKTTPINECNFLSTTVNDLPSLDGIYYGGGGSQGACDGRFFFDYTTDAMIMIRGLNYFVSDIPLLVDAEPIRVRN